MEKIIAVSPYRYFSSPSNKLRLFMYHYETPCIWYLFECNSVGLHVHNVKIYVYNSREGLQKDRKISYKSQHDTPHLP